MTNKVSLFRRENLSDPGSFILMDDAPFDIC